MPRHTSRAMAYFEHSQWLLSQPPCVRVLLESLISALQQEHKLSYNDAVCVVRYLANEMQAEIDSLRRFGK